MGPWIRAGSRHGLAQGLARLDHRTSPRGLARLDHRTFHRGGSPGSTTERRRGARPARPPKSDLWGPWGFTQLEVVGVSTGNYTFVVTQNHYRHPCDACESCYSCEPSPRTGVAPHAFRSHPLPGPFRDGHPAGAGARRRVRGADASTCWVAVTKRAWKGVGPEGMRGYSSARGRFTRVATFTRVTRVPVEVLSNYKSVISSRHADDFEICQSPWAPQITFGGRAGRAPRRPSVVEPGEPPGRARVETPHAVRGPIHRGSLCRSTPGRQRSNLG